MKYRNVKTGFVFETSCEIKGEGWVKLDPQPTISKGVEEKPKTTKTVTKRAKK